MCHCVKRDETISYPPVIGSKARQSLPYLVINRMLQPCCSGSPSVLVAGSCICSCGVSRGWTARLLV